MDGSIGVNSQPGLGSMFGVRLPNTHITQVMQVMQMMQVTQGPQTTPPEGATAPASASASGPTRAATDDSPGTVLYIEDTAVNVVLMEASWPACPAPPPPTRPWWPSKPMRCLPTSTLRWTPALPASSPSRCCWKQLLDTMQRGLKRVN